MNIVRQKTLRKENNHDGFNEEWKIKADVKTKCYFYRKKLGLI